MSVKNEPHIEAYIGSTGSGKGVSINRRLGEMSPPRLLIWDPRDEYKKWAPKFTSIKALAEAFHLKAGPVRARFVAGDGDLKSDFEHVCKIAFAAGNLLFLAEELSDVTTASHAPPAWRKIITQGRHQGLAVFGAAQRPALIDKNFLGGCTYIRCFNLRYREDRRAMASAMDVNERDITDLSTVKAARSVTINYLERDFRAGTEAQRQQIRLTR